MRVEPAVIAGAGGGGSSRRRGGEADALATTPGGAGGGGVKAGKRPRNAAAAGAANKRPRRPPTPSVWTTHLQAHLGTALRLALAQEGSPAPTEEHVASLPPTLNAFGKMLKESGACEQVRSLGSTLNNVCATLQVGGYGDPEDFLNDVRVEVLSAAQGFLIAQNPDVRKGRVTSIGEAFTTVVSEELDKVLNEYRKAASRDWKEKQAKIAEEEAKNPQLVAEQRVYQPPLRVPPSIMANREPFKHGDWRKTPYVPRPYERLDKYHIVEEKTRPVIEHKLSTQKRGGCDGKHCIQRERLGSYSVEAESFQSECTCLQRNTECDEGCKCNSKNCLNRAVTKRETVKMGEDIDEIDSWGLDCYTRRNIYDAILESQAFGIYELPNYAAMVRAAAAAAAGGGKAGRKAAAAATATMALTSRDDLKALVELKEYIAAHGELPRLCDSGDGDKKKTVEFDHLCKWLYEQRLRYKKSHGGMVARTKKPLALDEQRSIEDVVRQGTSLWAAADGGKSNEGNGKAGPGNVKTKEEEEEERDGGAKCKQLLAELWDDDNGALLAGGSEQTPLKEEAVVNNKSQETITTNEDGESDEEIAPPPPLIDDKPPPTPEEQLQKTAVEKAIHEWIDRIFVPAINRQGDNGWDIFRALTDVKERAQKAGDVASLIAAEAVEERAKVVGYNYFRIHPKGIGLVCRRQGGIPRLTFVEEYLGEIHCPWRWFELQDSVKKITGDELPDFYNIVLERPKDDPQGYDVLYVDAAAKGAFASRMSHSCTPNCQAIVMACGGRLTIALYTLRDVQEGEELTFDYSSVTESEKEFREAICLCSSTHCRGSYLCYTGSRAFQQVMNAKHTFLHRQATLLIAGCEKVTAADRARLASHGIKSSALGGPELGDRVPEWVEKWAALICEYIELEEAILSKDLLTQPRSLYTESSAAAEARGIAVNRVQNVVVTLDKIKMFLQSDLDQPQGPLLRLLPDKEVANYLWNDSKSIAKRLLRGAAKVLAPVKAAMALQGAETNQQLKDAVVRVQDGMPASLTELCTLVVLHPPVKNAEAARTNLLELGRRLRSLDVQIGRRLTAAADMAVLYGYTQKWFTPERGYKALTSPPVPINLEDLFLNREQEKLLPPSKNNTPLPGSSGVGAIINSSTKAPKVLPPPPAATGTVIPKTEEELVVEAAIKEAEAKEKAEAEEKKKKAAAAKAAKASKSSALRKIYRPTYIWGQMSGWFKQTVNDPSASLSAERRGTLSLPDIESCFTGKGGYSLKERNSVIETIEKRPDNLWKTGTLWSFRNEGKIYGSPHFDQVYAELTGDESATRLGEALKELKEALLPPMSMQATKSRASDGGGSSGGGRGRGRRGGGRGRGGGRKRKGEDEFDEEEDMFDDMRIIV